MYGENNFVAKAVCLLMDMEKMIGDKYDEGLANLKRIVEGEPAAVGADDKPAQSMEPNSDAAAAE
jgi:hypothetical protein